MENKFFQKLGLGCWGFSGDSYGPISEDNVLAILNLAFDLGINYYDTSDSYGEGRSESLLGKFIKRIGANRNKIKISTKGGLLPHKTFYMPTNFSASYISNCINTSLKRLNTDRIDIYNLHSPNVNEINNNDELLRSLEERKRQGDIAEIGVSARSPRDAVELAKFFNFDSVQVNYNLIDQRIKDDFEFVEIYSKKRVTARTPFAFGYLIGSVPIDKSLLTENDHRKKWDKEQINLWNSAIEKFSRFRQENQLTEVECALLFAMSEEIVDHVIPGMMSTEQLLENINAAKKNKFTLTQLNEVREIYSNTNWFIPGIKKDKLCTS